MAFHARQENTTDHRNLMVKLLMLMIISLIGGHKAKGPRLFGVAKEDISCRCTTIEVVEDIEPKLRKDNDNKKIVKYKNYADWFR